MYMKVMSPGKKLTKQWLDQAFAPLNDYLGKAYPETKVQMAGYLMFMGNENEKFYYKNSMTRASIVFDQSGALVSVDQAALQYEFEDWFGPKGEYKALEDYSLHPNVSQWIKRTLSRSEKSKYGLEVGVFLQELWGPMVNYDFSDLKVGYPLRRSFSPYYLYVYPSKFRSLVAFQFVGDEIVEYSCTIKEHNEYINKQNYLTIAGWRGVVMIREMLENITQLKEFLPLIIEHAALRR
jgi:hypothetical protein